MLTLLTRIFSCIPDVKNSGEKREKWYYKDMLRFKMMFLFYI